MCFRVSTGSLIFIDMVIKLKHPGYQLHLLLVVYTRRQLRLFNYKLSKKTVIGINISGRQK